MESAIAEAANKAVTMHFKRPAFKELISDVVASAVGEAVSALKPKENDDDDDGGTDDVADTEAKDGNVSKEVTRALKKLQKDNERLTQRLEEAEGKRQEAIDKAKEGRERSTLLEALQKIGIDKEMLEPAVSLHRGRIKTTDDDKVVFVDEDEDEVSVADGIAGWAETPQSKRFKPARDVSGSGNSGGEASTMTVGKDGEVTDAQLGELFMGR